MKKILIMNGSPTEIPLIKGAKKLGYYVITTGNMPELPGHQFADEYICGDYSDKDAMLKLAKDNNIDAVCSCANDFGAISASYVAEKMGLPGHDPYAVTTLLHQKDNFKYFAKEYGILTPPADIYTSLKEALNKRGTYNFPLIVKPVDLTGGKGVSKIEGPSQYEDAVKRAFATTRKGTIVVEKFIQGSQHGLCTYILDKKVAAYCSNDEYSFINPYRVEMDTFPATGIERCAPILIEQVEKIASILNISNGIFHLQYREDEDGPHIIEVMRRILGNMYSVPADALLAFDWNYWELCAKAGLPLDTFPLHTAPSGYFAYKSIMAAKNGRIKAIHISGSYKPFLTSTYMFHQINDRIDNYMTDPIGLLFFKFNSMAEMHDILLKAPVADMVEIE